MWKVGEGLHEKNLVKGRGRVEGKGIVEGRGREIKGMETRGVQKEGEEVE